MDVIEYYVPVERIKRVRHVPLIIFVPVFIILIVLLCLLIIREQRVCDTEKCKKLSKDLYNFINESNDPCNDFYEYACGSVKKKRSVNFISTVNLEMMKVNKQLEDLIKGPIYPNDSTSVILQKQFYQSCRDVDAIERESQTVILRIIRELGGWPVLEEKWNENNFDVFEMMIKTRKKGDYYQWFLDISGEMEYTDPHKRDMIRIDLPTVNNIHANHIPEYLEILIDVCVALGAKKDQASSDMKSLIMFEKELAQIVDEVQSSGTNHQSIFTIDNIKTPWPKIYWLMFLTNVSQSTLSNHDRVLFAVGNYLPKLGTLLQKTNKRTQANYIFWKIIESYAPHLPTFLRERINKYRILLPGYDRANDFKENRDNFCFEKTLRFFQYVSEAQFARNNEHKLPDVKEMLENICCATRKAILKCEWMDEETKEKALIKLGKIRYIIGAPKEVYNEIEFNRILGLHKVKYYSNNVIEMERELFRRSIDHSFDLERPKITKEKIKFYSIIPTQNAEFIMDSNTMVVPSGILQGEFYSSNRQTYLNYGALGNILAHEMAHGFGIEGSTYREGNKTTNWWSGQTKKSFFKTVECLLKNCSAGNEQINCKSTLDENFADYAGVQLAFDAYQEWVNKYGVETSLPGLKYDDPNQIFFTKYATLMCRKTRQYDDTRHLHPRDRIFGAYRNNKLFSNIFYCQDNAIMNPNNKCVVL